MHVNSLPHSEAYPLENPAPNSRRSRPRIGADTFPWSYHVCMRRAGKIVRVEGFFFLATRTTKVLRVHIKGPTWGIGIRSYPHRTPHKFARGCGPKYCSAPKHPKSDTAPPAGPTQGTNPVG